MARSIPLSARRSKALDLNTVEHRARENPTKANRPFGLKGAHTYRPTEDEFRDPARYIASIEEEARKFGIAKIIPPDSWRPLFAIDTEVSADSSTDYQ
jgi:histone demethylase JARID1